MVSLIAEIHAVEIAIAPWNEPLTLDHIPDSSDLEVATCTLEVST